MSTVLMHPPPSLFAPQPARQPRAKLFIRPPRRYGRADEHLAVGQVGWCGEQEPCLTGSGERRAARIILLRPARDIYLPMVMITEHGDSEP